MGIILVLDNKKTFQNFIYLLIMNCIPEVYKQLTHLSKTINQCNYISYEDKKDLVADSILNIFEKYNKGILVDDFNEIKGYTFITIRNSCIAFRKRNRVSYFDNLQEVPNIDNNQEHKDIEYLHKVINNHIQHPKYTDQHKQVCELLMQNKYDDEINEIMDLEPGKLGKLKFTMKLKLQTDIKRPLKYIIKNKFDKNINIPCYKRPDIIEFFKGKFNPKQISAMIYHNFMSFDGYYIVKQFKKEEQ